MSRSGRGKRTALVLALLLGGVLAAGLVVLRPVLLEMYYLSELNGSDRHRRRSALERLGEMRSSRAAMPLARIIREERFREDYQRSIVFSRIADVQMEADLEMAALMALEKIGPRAREALPVLLEALSRGPINAFQGVAIQEAKTLAAAGARDLPLLLQALREKKGVLHDIVAQALGLIGPEAREAVPVLIEVSRDDDDETFRHAVVWALGRIGPDAIPALTGSLVSSHGQDGHGFYVAARALKETEAGTEALLAHLGHPQPRARAAAAFAIGWLAWPDRKGLEKGGTLLGGLLRDGEVRVRRAAAFAMRSFPSAGRSFLPRLVDLLEDGDRDVRWFAARAIGAVGPAAVSAVPALTRALDDEKTIRDEVITALGKIGPGAGESVPALIRWLLRNESYDFDVAKTLGSIGPRAAAAVPELLKMLRSGWAANRFQAARAIARIGPVSDDIVPALLLALGDKDPVVRRHAVEALGAMGEAGKKAIPLLKGLLEDGDEFVRSAASKVLENLEDK